MYTTHTGYTVEISDVERAMNMFNSCVELQASHPGNPYWMRRLISAYNELVRLDLIQERTTYQNWKSAESDFAKCKKDPTVSREVFKANRSAAHRWWMRMLHETGRSTSPYHFFTK